jgi:hypothetical protein
MKQMNRSFVRQPDCCSYQWLRPLVTTPLYFLPILLLMGCFPFMFERPAQVHQVALGDLNGNGHLDAYLNIGSGGGEPYVRPDYLLFNDGHGRFDRSREFEGIWPGLGVMMADFSGNGLADILLEFGGSGIVYYTNQGDAGFRQDALAPSAPVGVMRLHPVAGDLNGDGHLDLFAAGCCGREANSSVPPLDDHLLPYSQVWLNQGDGRLVITDQFIGTAGSNAAALADLNGNGHLDAFLANGRTMDMDTNYRTETPNTVWFNDGEGLFEDSGQQLGQAESTAVALGDLNGNGFVDAVVGNRGADEVWFNDGQGVFSDSGQRLGSGHTRSVYLADLNGNGRLDLIVAGEAAVQVWFSDGTGRFTAGQQISHHRYEAIAVGDVTGDGHLDIFVAGVTAYQVWRGEGNGRFTADPRHNFR